MRMFMWNSRDAGSSSGAEPIFVWSKTTSRCHYSLHVRALRT